MQIEDMDFLQSPRLKSLQSKAEESQSEDDKKRFLMTLTREIINNLSEVTVSNLSDGVNVNNLDQVRAALHNELAKSTKAITTILNKLRLSTDEQTKFLKDVQEKADNEIDDTVQTVIIKRIKDRVEVTNLSDINIPEAVSVNNLSELLPALEKLSRDISALKLSVNVDAPQIIVQPTPVNIPETIINTPALNLDPIINSIEDNLKLIKRNNKSNPLAVRLTDGSDWIKEIRKQNAQTTQFMSDVSYIRNAAGQRINPATDESTSPPTTITDNSKNVTTAGTRVQLISSVTPCRYVIVVAKDANTDTIWVGGATVAAGRGRPLVSLQAEKIDINDVSKVYIDSVVNGEGVTFVYVN